jgi:hypothetical protein
MAKNSYNARFYFADDNDVSYVGGVIGTSPFSLRDIREGKAQSFLTQLSINFGRRAGKKGILFPPQHLQQNELNSYMEDRIIQIRMWIGTRRPTIKMLEWKSCTGKEIFDAASLLDLNKEEKEISSQAFSNYLSDLYECRLNKDCIVLFGSTNLRVFSLNTILSKWTQEELNILNGDAYLYIHFDFDLITKLPFFLASICRLDESTAKRENFYLIKYKDPGIIDFYLSKSKWKKDGQLISKDLEL